MKEHLLPASDGSLNRTVHAWRLRSVAVAWSLWRVIRTRAMAKLVASLVPSSALIALVFADSPKQFVLCTVIPVLMVVGGSLATAAHRFWVEETRRCSWVAGRLTVREAQVTALESAKTGYLATLVGFQSTMELLDADLNVIETTQFEGADQQRVIVPFDAYERFADALARGEVGTYESYFEREGVGDHPEFAIKLTMPSMKYTHSRGLQPPVE